MKFLPQKCLNRLRYLHMWLHCFLCSQECWSTIHSPATPEYTLVFTQMIELFSVQSWMLEYNALICNTWASFDNPPDDGILLCTIRKARVHLSRIWYLHRLLHCSLLSKECWSTIHSLAISSGICTCDCIVLCEIKNFGVQYIHLLHMTRLWYLHGWLHCPLHLHSRMIEYNTYTCYITKASSGVHTGDYIVLCAVRNAGV